MSDCPLGPAEFDVLAGLADGLTPAEIAARRGRSVQSVRSNLHTAYRKLGVSTGAAAVATMLRNGWHGYVPPPEAELSPFLRAYLVWFDEYLVTGSQRAWDGMAIALLGQMHRRNVCHVARDRQRRRIPDRLLLAALPRH